jgi:hypothetical protein
MLMNKTSWNKGLTKKTSVSVQRISNTMRKKKIDNFAKWREKAKEEGLVKNSYDSFIRDENLAELLGVILGDGYIGEHPRTECLRIVSNSNNSGFIKRYERIVTDIFKKKPTVKKRKNSEAVDIVLYEKHIAKRLGLKTGAKTHRPFLLPSWIKNNKQYKIHFLRGLYETDGYVGHHEATYTHKLVFYNVNQSLLKLVFDLVSELGFHPHGSKTCIQVSRKVEVDKLSKLVHFREYS